MANILMILGFIFLPVVILYACHRYTAIDKIGAGLLSFSVGILLANVGLLPEGIADILP